jgi:D-aminopeptidase
MQSKDLEYPAMKHRRAMFFLSGGNQMSTVRARDLGIDIGIFKTGTHNAITDVEGVKVGQVTITEGNGKLVPGKGPVRTGITVILPHGGNLFRKKVQAGCFVLNGFGKSVGLHQIRELGTIETPIALTNTLSVFQVADALVGYCCDQSPEIGIETGTVNPVVGDINDGYLNDIQGRHVKPEHVFAAIRTASAGPVAEGNVGGGTGCSCFGFKGGIGTSSRKLPERMGAWTIGVVAQTNFGGVLSIQGAPIGREMGVFDFKGKPDGSCMVVIATDAPLDARLLERLAKRAGLGMARTGFYSANGSGDFFIAFSTANTISHEIKAGNVDAIIRSVLPDDSMSALFAALVEAVEEAIINSLIAATTMVGRDGNTRHAIDHNILVGILDRYNGRNWSGHLATVSDSSL